LREKHTGRKKQVADIHPAIVLRMLQKFCSKNRHSVPKFILALYSPSHRWLNNTYVHLLVTWKFCGRFELRNLGRLTSGIWGRGKIKGESPRYGGSRV
jgi:hypothetical protein